MRNPEGSEGSIRNLRHQTSTTIRGIENRRDRLSYKTEGHVEAVAQKIGELGLAIGKKVVFNERILTIKTIDLDKGSISFEEPGIPKISVFSPSLEIYKEEVSEQK